jgi:hypothetical protein
MNRLILIGNGFDLAHGLKTSYNDFILWYLKKCYFEGFQRQFYEDPLLQITRNFDYKGKRRVYDFDSVGEFIEASYLESFIDLGLNIPVKGNDYSNQFPFHTTASNLMRALLNNCSYTRWVDIETEFYDLLKAILKKEANYLDKQKDLIALNESLQFLIIKLEEFLKTLPNPAYDDRYGEIFNSQLKKFDILLPWSEGPQWRSEERFKINRTCILNFNYTNTVELYMRDVPTMFTPEFINVHGQLNNKKNPIVFGFGDELDEDYLKMERERAKGYFRYIKSFWYFNTSSYWDLIRFVDSEEFIIFILGHSCGLTDRTMLHMIFEHKNCKSIKIFYHGDETSNNYRETTYEIARHFNDKELMRRSVIPFERSIRMPQFNDPR